MDATIEAKVQVAVATHSSGFQTPKVNPTKTPSPVSLATPTMTPIAIAIANSTATIVPTPTPNFVADEVVIASKKWIRSPEFLDDFISLVYEFEESDGESWKEVLLDAAERRVSSVMEADTHRWQSIWDGRGRKWEITLCSVFFSRDYASEIEVAKSNGLELNNVIPYGGPVLPYPAPTPAFAQAPGSDDIPDWEEFTVMEQLIRTLRHIDRLRGVEQDTAFVYRSANEYNVTSADIREAISNFIKRRESLPIVLEFNRLKENRFHASYVEFGLLFFEGLELFDFESESRHPVEGWVIKNVSPALKKELEMAHPQLPCFRRNSDFLNLFLENGIAENESLLP